MADKTAFLLGDIVSKVRSKNAGPFWATIDIFCGSKDVFSQVEEKLSTRAVSQVLGQPSQELKRFALPDLNVIKFSLPRPEVQGSLRDRDMHGAQWAVLIAQIELTK